MLCDTTLKWVSQFTPIDEVFDINDGEYLAEEPVIACKTIFNDSTYGKQMLSGELNQQRKCCQISWIGQIYCNQEYKLMQVKDIDINPVYPVYPTSP